MRRGIVTGFDVHTGLGVVTLDPVANAGDGAIDDASGASEVVGFHCVAIVDGTRSIEVGAPVDVIVGVRLGERRATSIDRR